MKKMFYDNVVALDEYRGLQSPTGEQIQSLLEYLSHDEYAKYFFTDLKNPIWVLPLYENGLFTKVPPPLEDPNNRGYFSMPMWPAGEYLKTMADKYPDVVKNVALSLSTDNSRAIRTMLEALLKIPASVTAEIVSEFNRWIKTPYSNFMMLSHELGIIMEYLVKGGQVDAALMVLNILFEPIQIKDPFDEAKLIASTRHDFYWLNQAIQENLPILTETDPIGVVSVTEKQLIKAIDLEIDPKIDEKAKKRNSYWRLSISPRSDLNYERDFKNLLVNTIIIALSKACEQKLDQASEIIANYMESEYLIFRRISIYILRTWGKQYQDLLEKAYIGYRKEPIIAGQSEFNRFLEAQFNNLPEFAKKEVLQERKNPDLQRADDLVKSYPEKFSGETEVEKRQTIIETWQLEDLTPIAAYLEGEEKKYYEYLLMKYGQPSPRPEEGVVITSWEGPESPIELNDLTKKSIDDVVHTLLDFVPSDEASFGKPSREGLGRTFEADVQARANDYAQNALVFINEKLPFIYHTHYFRGLENATKNQVKFALADVIALCEFIVGKDKDQFSEQEDEEDLPSAKLAIANWLEEVFRIKDPDMENDLLDKSGQIISKLLDQDDPFLGNEQETGFDPATRSLNSIRGTAMHCLVSYGLYIERKRKKEKGTEGKPEMVSLVKELLTEKLNKTKEPSLTVHSVLGWYFPQFIYLDKEWALENRERIFPTESDMARYWQAAWGAYVRFSDVYTNVFPELIIQYQRALEELPTSEKKQALGSVSEKMATHILKAYLLDMIKLDSDDRLISLYYMKADDETRSHGNFWLSQVLDAQKPSAEDRNWLKIWSLWKWRVEYATSSDDRSSFAKEIVDFCRLLKNAPLELPDLASVLQSTLEFKTEGQVGGYELGLIIDYLGGNSEKYPDLAVSILHKLIFSRQLPYLLSDTIISIEKIFTSAFQANDETKTKVVELINFFGEQGDYSWRPFLDKFRE